MDQKDHLHYFQKFIIMISENHSKKYQIIDDFYQFKNQYQSQKQLKLDMQLNPSKSPQDLQKKLFLFTIQQMDQLNKTIQNHLRQMNVEFIFDSRKISSNDFTKIFVSLAIKYTEIQCSQGNLLTDLNLNEQLKNVFDQKFDLYTFHQNLMNSNYLIQNLVQYAKDQILNYIEKNEENIKQVYQIDDQLLTLMKSQIKLGSPPTDIILSISAYALKLNIYIIDFLDLYQHKEKKFNGGSTHKVYILSINKIEFYPLYFQLQKQLN